MKRLLAALLSFVPGYRYRAYRLRAARNARIFLWQLNEMYDNSEGVFRRLSRAIKGREYRDDPYLTDFELWIDNIELRAVMEEGEKFGTSPFHDFEFHRRANTMCRVLYQQSVKLILTFNCDGPLRAAISQNILRNIRGAIAIMRDLPEAPDHFSRFEVLYRVALAKLKLPTNIAEADDDVEPERLCLLWLWVLTQVHTAINRIVIAQFGLADGDAH